LARAANDGPASGWIAPVGVVLSVAFHAVTFFLLGTVQVDSAVAREQVVEFEFAEPEPLPEPPPPQPEAKPEPEPEPEPIKPPPKAREAAPKPVEEAPPPDPTPPAPAEETIEDFTGTTLTAEGGGGGWLTATGSGAPMNGPVGKAKGAVTGRDRAGTDGGAIGGTGTRVLGEGDLSRQPKAPSSSILEEALRREYPKQAQQQGVEGVAKVRMRVMSSGKLSPLATLNETYPGFADACKRSLKNVRFEPALDHQGQPATTDITYNCTFELE
jgi:TonB family protein